MMAGRSCVPGDFHGNLLIFCSENLVPVIEENVHYFSEIRNEYYYSDKFSFILQKMLEYIEWYQKNLDDLIDNAPLYDFKNVPGNGYRSFTLIIERCFKECYKSCKDIFNARNSLFFRSGKYLRKLENHISILEGLKSGLIYIKKMLSNSTAGQLLNLDKSLTADEFISEYGLINQIGFYGSCQGFYYCQSMRKTLRGVSCILAAFSDLYQKGGSPLSRAIASLINVAKYFFYPDLRSQQIVNVAQNSSIEFLKAFWSLNETDFMKKLPRWICPKLEVEMEFFIPAEAINLPNVDCNETIIIPVPSSHIPPAPVRCLLLSSQFHQGQMLPKGKGQRPCAALSAPSPALLIHCHGGGFISQSPESHEIYLRSWAHELNVPILSIDYSLSPAAVFPRAVEEVLLVYAWCLKNFQQLGWTGERVGFVGDSAGGNVLMGTVLKVISLGIRKPDAILCAYTPLILDVVPSPSRLLCWVDPLLPLGFMISCLGAYAGIEHVKEDEYVNEILPLKSPMERKVSSISEIFDSSLHFLKESEWREVEANEPDAINSSKLNDSDTKLHERKWVEYQNEKGLFQHNTLRVSSSDYVACFLEEYTTQLKNRKSTTMNYADDFDQLLFNFPQDVYFSIKKTYCSFVHNTFGRATDFISQNKIFKQYVSPVFKLLPVSPFIKSQINSTDFKESNFSIIQKIKKLKLITKDSFMSPLLASEDVLRKMPSIYFVSLNFDPCLDDSITFCKRMSAAGQHVVLDVLDGLPHGFLNFLPFSQEAHDGSDLCIQRLREALKLCENTV